MIERPRIVVAAVIERDGRFLLVEERSGDRIVYNQPAGHLEAGETLIEAVTRETREETAWGFRPTNLVGVYHWSSLESQVTYLRFCFSGECLDHDNALRLDEGILRACWFTYDEILERFEQHRSPLVLRCIDDYLAGKEYPLTLYTHLPAA